MESSSSRKLRHQHQHPPTTSKPSSWCCSFTTPPMSPEPSSKTPRHLPSSTPNPNPNPNTPKSFPNSPLTPKSIVNRRRILSPGRVSPIPIPIPDSESDTFPPPIPNVGPAPPVVPPEPVNLGGKVTDFDVRLDLKGRRGACMGIEASSDVLSRNSAVFAGFIDDYRRRRKDSAEVCRIEVPEVENLGVFRQAVELMFEEDITRRLFRVGAYRAIDILQVSAEIKFSRGVLSCLKYLEAVPWTEEEEEKLRRVFTKFKFDDDTSKEILARLNLHDSTEAQQNLASQLVWSITSCANPKARNELKSMVKGLFCKSSIYNKDQQDIRKEELYDVSRSCLVSLTALLEEATSTAHRGPANEKKQTDKPLVERISWQVDNLNWLFEILLDRQMAENFVDIWADQEELLRMHGCASPLIRYELSRVSAVLFIAMGTRKLQCRSESRFELFQTWFEPMLLDFGWLQRSKKGLDIKELEEAMGQALLTLPLQQQYTLFMKWFKHFSKHGNDSPNLSKAFQIWWRRTFLRGNESHDIESR